MLESTTQHTFTAGELSPKLHSRPDLKKYSHGLREALNVIIERHGGAVRRTGSVCVGMVPGNAIGRLVSFNRSSNLNMVIEVVANQFRFYQADGTLLRGSGGNVLTVETPWDETEIDGLRFAQTGDVVYITHPSYKPRKLSRTDLDTFVMAVAAISGGPFLAEQADEAVRIQASAATGTITLTSTAPVFQESHEGSLWKLRWEDRSKYYKWQSQWGWNVGSEAISRGKAFRATTPGISGANAPDHTEGIENDGHETNDANIAWEYLHSGYGVLEIIDFIDDQRVTARLVEGNQLPEDIVRIGTKYWSEAAWSDVKGWPSSVTFYNDRLAYARDNEVYLSQNGDFENMAPTDEHGDITATSSLRFVLSDDQANTIRWIKQVQDVLIIGTTGSEWALGPQSNNQPFGPDNVLAAPQSYHGTADFAQPERINEALLFISRSKRRLYEMTAQQVTTRYEAVELSILSDHLLKDGIIESVYTESPEGVVWFLTGAGKLIAMTYERGQEVVGWHRHEFGGDDVFVESIAGIPSADETYDELWMLVARTVDGVLTRSVERMAAPFESGDLATDGVFLDAAMIFEGAPVSSVRVAHLPNTKIDCLADGRVIQGLETDATGEVLLPYAASRVVVGLAYTSRIKTLRPAVNSQIGSSLGKKITIPNASVTFEQTNLCEYGQSDQATDTLIFADTNQLTDTAVPLFTGQMIVNFSSNHEQDISVCIEQKQPLPLTVRAVTYDVNSANRF